MPERKRTGVCGLSKLTNKKILISTEQQNAQVGIFFREIGFELCSDFEKTNEYLFIVDDYLEEIKNLPRIQTQKMLSAQSIPNVRGSFDQSFIGETHVNSLLQSYFCAGKDFDLIDQFSSDLKTAFNIKVHDYLNIGYFIDTIVVEAYKNSYDFDLIRNYLNDAITSALKLIEQDSKNLPLDITYAFNETGFVVQITINSPELDMSGEFKNSNSKLVNFSNRANYFDVSYFKKRNKLVMSSLWFKEKKLQSFHSYFYTEVAEHKNVKDSGVVIVNSLDEVHEAVDYFAQVEKVDQSKKLFLAKKFCLFIKNFRVNEENAAELSALTLEDIDTYLLSYPRQEAVVCIDIEVKEFIIKLLRDDALYNGVSDYIKKIADSNLDSHVEDIQKILGQKSLEDISEILRIQGGAEKSGSDVTVVKGWAEVNNEEEWQVKRTEILEETKEQVFRIQSSGRKVVEDDIIKIVSGQMNANPEEVKTVVSGLVEEAVSSTLVKNEKLEDSLPLRIMAQPPENNIEIEKIKIQNARMKKIMEQMKSEMVLLRQENENAKKEDQGIESVDAQVAEMIDLKNALGRTLDIMKIKEKIALKQKMDFEQILEAKETKNAALESRLEQLKDEYSKSKDFSNDEKLEILSAENRSLITRLEIATQKVSIINENMNKQDSDTIAKKDKQITTLKTNIQFAQSLIEKFKQERSDFENKLIEEKEKYIKLKDEKFSPVAPAAVVSKDHSEKEKLMGIELKKMEQKLKFTIAQLEEAQKRKAQTGGASNKSNEAHLKQLEQANSRIADANNDLAEKKKEAIKLKQENSQLSAKITELEKKLGHLEKKAA
ncbi:MAG: hypothetical protein Q7U04_00675 [Bacteriovorax sp.]|nr:hypothetical protein [Bacteriovorax sp.]